MSPEDPGPTVWWPAKWVREESFWRDVTTRSLSAVIVLILVGIVNGYIKRHLSGLAHAVFVLVMSFLLIRQYLRSKPKNQHRVDIAFGVFIGVGVLNLVYHWVKYLVHR